MCEHHDWRVQPPLWQQHHHQYREELSYMTLFLYLGNYLSGRQLQQAFLEERTQLNSLSFNISNLISTIHFQALPLLCKKSNYWATNFLISISDPLYCFAKPFIITSPVSNPLSQFPHIETAMLLCLGDAFLNHSNITNLIWLKIFCMCFFSRN